MLHLRKVDYKPSASKAMEIDSKQVEDFILKHDETYQDVYWTGSRIIKSHKFKIFTLQLDNYIDDYVVVSDMNRDEEEIYFLNCVDKSQKEELIHKAIEFVFMKSESVLLLLDQTDMKDIDLYQNIGFKVKEKIITFSIDKL
jgi:hypothetical protein